MSPVETLSFKCALITGGGGGLGKAMAIELLRRGKKVLLAGRSKDKLVATTKEIGASGYYVLDTGDIPSIPAFIEKLTSEHPEVDCLINNAGVQRPLQLFSEEYDFDLKSADQEIDINIRGPMHLSIGLIEKHFKNLPNGAVVMNVSSVLGFVPFSVINPVYNGTKAWLHMFSTNLRTQLGKSGDEGAKQIKIVEIVPPAVETDLHRDRTNPDDNKKANMPHSLSIEEFMDDVKEGWESNQDTVSAGPGKEVVKVWNETLGARYTKMAQ
ncbi:hypothetical protein IAU59_006949 [Kwoniella sp. CBS 9459]